MSVDLIPKDLADPLSAPNFTTRAQPAKASENTNTALGTGLAGVGDFVDKGTKSLFEGVTTKIKDEVQGSVNPIRDAQLVRAPEGGVAAAPDNAAIAEYKKGVRRMVAAKQGGVISDTKYYMDLESMTRAIRARYPGFRDEVDAAIRSETGVNPANALRKSQLNDLEAATRAAQGKASDIDKLYQKDLNEGLVPPEIAGAIGNNTQKRAEWLSTHGVRIRNDRYNNSVAKQLLDLRSSEVTYNAKTATQDIKRITQNVSGQITAEFSRSITENLMKRFNGSGPISPEDIAAGEPPLAIMKSALDKEWAAILKAQTKNGLLGSLPSSGDLVAVKKEFYSRYTELNAALHSGDRTLLKKVLDENKLYGAMFALRARGNDTVALYQGLTAALGKDVTVALLSSREGRKLRVEFAKQLGLFIKEEELRNSIGRVTKDTSGQKEASQAVVGTFKAGVDLLSNDKVSSKVKNTVVHNLFAPRNREFLVKSVKEKQKLFQQMVSSGMVKSILGPGSVISDEGRKDYTKFVEDNFSVVFKTELDSIKKDANSRWYKVIFDPKEARFTVGPSDIYLKQEADLPGSTKESRQNSVRVNRSDDLRRQEYEKGERAIKERMEEIQPVLSKTMEVFKTQGRSNFSDILGDIARQYPMFQNAPNTATDNSVNTKREEQFEKGSIPTGTKDQLRKDLQKLGSAGTDSSLGFSSAAQQRSKTDVGSNVFSYADAAAYSSNASQAIKKVIVNEDTGKPYTHNQLVNSSKAIVKSIKNGEPIVYSLKGRTRKQRLQPGLENTLATVAKEYGVSVLVTSGGQPARYRTANGQLSPRTTKDRTGGHRHNGGGAGDVEFVTREGRALSHHNTEDRVIMANIITSLVARGVNGVGAGPGYMGNTGAKMHIGGGSGTHWNKSTRGGTGDPWLRAAWEKGMALRKSGGNWKPKRLASKD